jgi:hypothetical protein
VERGAVCASRTSVIARAGEQVRVRDEGFNPRARAGRDQGVGRWLIPPVFPDFYQFEIPPFRLGPLRSEKLRYRSNKAGSDYYERYRDAFRDAWAVEREPKTVRVLDLMSFRHRIFDSPPFIPPREPWKHQAWPNVK